MWSEETLSILNDTKRQLTVRSCIKDKIYSGYWNINKRVCEAEKDIGTMLFIRLMSHLKLLLKGVVEDSVEARWWGIPVYVAYIYATKCITSRYMPYLYQRT
jgi:hypothetical protein